MSRGYRRVIIAAVGWLILCGAHSPQEQADSSRGAQQAPPPPSATTTPTPAPTASPSSQFTAYGSYDADSCYHARDPNAANLCAYWRAAIAAEKSAHEARRATNWAIVATFLSLIGVTGLIWSIWQTHGALDEARRGNRLNLLFEKRARREAREASRDTGTIIQETRRQADAAVATQRAWVTLTLRAQQVKRSGIDGLYFMVDFVAENIGDTIATHFSIDYDVFFRGQYEKIEDLDNRIERRIDEFRQEYDSSISYCIVPKDRNVSHFWASRNSEDIDWWTGTIFGYDVTHMVFVSAVFYRTIHHPETVQMSWRSWYLSERSSEDGQASTFIKKNTETLGSDRLSADPLRIAMMHEPFAAKPDDTGAA